MEVAETTFTWKPNPAETLSLHSQVLSRQRPRLLLNFPMITRSITCEGLQAETPHSALCETPSFQSIQLPVVQPCHQISRNKTSCCDLGMEPQKV